MAMLGSRSPRGAGSTALLWDALVRSIIDEALVPCIGEVCPADWETATVDCTNMAFDHHLEPPSTIVEKSLQWYIFEHDAVEVA